MVRVTVMVTGQKIAITRHLSFDQGSRGRGSEAAELGDDAKARGRTRRGPCNSPGYEKYLISMRVRVRTRVRARVRVRVNQAYFV